MGPNVDDIMRRSIVLLLPVETLSEPPHCWTIGPLPDEWIRRRENNVNVLTGTANGRIPYVHPHVVRVLYERNGRPIRWHRCEGFDPAPEKSALEVSSLEFLRIPDEKSGINGLIMIHGSILTSNPAEFLDHLKTAVNFNPVHGKEMRDWLERCLDGWARVDERSRKATFIAFVTPASDRLARIYDGNAY